MGVGGKVYYYQALDNGRPAVETSDRQIWAQIDFKLRQYIDFHKHWSLGLEAYGVAKTAWRLLLGGEQRSVVQHHTGIAQCVRHRNAC